MTGARFLPERLRPSAPGLRRVRRGLAVLVVLPVIVAAAPLWRIQEVTIDACPGIPAEVLASIDALEGRPTLTVRLADIRERLERWPGVASVDVTLELPGSLMVTARPCEVRGSIVAGDGWRAVHGDGSLGPALTSPQRPVLSGFLRDESRRQAVDVAERVAGGSGLTVTAVGWVTPDDLRLELVSDGVDPVAVVHVRPAGSAAERWWCERAARGELPGRWSDLRGASRVVVGGAP
mgnify:CR=1 FL=1